MNKKFLRNSFFTGLLINTVVISAYAHPLNPNITSPSFRRNRILLSQEAYSRKTIFFFGLERDISINGPSLTYTLCSAAGMDYYLTIQSCSAEIDGRKTERNGYAARLGFERDIWGDLIIFPLIKWTLDASYSNFSLEKFSNSNIDIGLQSYSINLSLIAALKRGPVIPYAGVKFCYAADEYIENKFDIKYSSDSSGASIVTGLKTSAINGFSARLEAIMIDEKSFSAGIEYEF
jgi:hypothetical protein